MKQFRHYFVTGVATLLPLSITLFVFWLIIVTLGDIFRPLFRITPWLARNVPNWAATLAGFALIILVIIFAGWAASSFAGRLAIAWLEGIVVRMPLAKGLYTAVREFADIAMSKHTSGRSTVIVEYPRTGVFSVGFALSDARIKLKDGGEGAFIFIPTTPHPTAGALEIVPHAQIIETPMSMEEGLRLVVSGGIIRPKNFAEYLVAKPGVRTKAV